MKRISILILASLLYACEDNETKNNDGCDFSNYPIYYDIQDIKATGLIYEGLDNEKYNWWNSSSKIEPNSNVKVDASKFIIALDAEFTTQLTKNKLKNTINLSPISTAIACSPPPQTTYEVISELKITSDQSFNSNYPAGSSLNDLFIVKFSAGYGVKSKFNFDSNTTRNVNEFVLESPPGMKIIHLMLSAAPELLKTHNFKIVYRHTNDERFEKYLGPITFQ